MRIPQRADGRKERSFHLIDGAVYQVRDGALVTAGKTGKELRELTALVLLRDSAVSLLDAEADHDLSEESLAPLRARLNVTYDGYVAAYGPLNRATITHGEPDPETGLATLSRRRPRMGGFRQDPDYVTVLALENYDEETGQAAKAPIFSQRVNQRPQRPIRADSPGEAIRVCLDTRGRLDLAVIADLLQLPADRVPEALQGLAYLDPQSGEWVTAEEYLSGNVRDKLKAARTAASPAGDTDPLRWASHVTALEEVQPADLGPEEIRAKLGAPWIPPGDVQAFAADTLGYAPAVTYLPVTAHWEVKAERGSADTAAATEEWGTGRIDGYRLLELAVNGRAPVIYDTVSTPDGETRVRNQAETMLAEEKQRALAARFAEWAWEDPARTDRLCAEYNRRFNSVVLRRYDGSHLTFPGMADGFTPYPHQRDMVHRILSSPACLCPYPVGTGKTPTMFMAARKLKELGLVSKPLIIVPNHLLEQTAREGKRLFPSARILMAAREDLDGAQARKLFAARCATGDWDAVVMTHSAFTAIPVHPATEAAHLTDLAARYRQALTAEPGGGSRTVKRLAKMIDTFETRARTLLDHRTDDGVYFEHLGADFLLVDESHYFKNLGLPVRTDGFSVAASKRATDLDMKLGLLRERGGRTAALFTGTPVSNSLLEMYVLHHYLHPQRLEELGLHSADAWAATFVEFQTSVEVTPDGASFRMKRRPANSRTSPNCSPCSARSPTCAHPSRSRCSALRHATTTSSSAPPRNCAPTWPASRNGQTVCGRLTRTKTTCSRSAATAARPPSTWTSSASRPPTRARSAPSFPTWPASTTPTAAWCCQVTIRPRPAAVSRSSSATSALPARRPVPRCTGRSAPGWPRRVSPPRRSGSSTTPAPTSRRPPCSLPAGPARSPCCSAPPTSWASAPTSRPGASHCTTWTPPGGPPTWNNGKAVRYGPATSTRRWTYTATSARSPSTPSCGRYWNARPGSSARSSGADQRAATFDDIGDATLSYAEVKALATGNPLLLELAETNAQVTRLRHLATAHVRAIRRLESSIAGWQQQSSAKTRLVYTLDRVAAAYQENPDPAWRDQRGNAIPGYDLASCLARLCREAMASTGYGAVRWRGLYINFSAEQKWRQITPIATIAADHTASVPVELNAAWTAKGQYWRIEKEITAFIAGAATAAGTARMEIEDLRRRISDATRRTGEPFPRPPTWKLPAAAATQSSRRSAKPRPHGKRRAPTTTLAVTTCSMRPRTMPSP